MSENAVPLSRSLTRREKIAILIAVSLTTFIVPFESSMTNLALPMIGREFQVGTGDLGWVSTAFLFMTSITLVPCSRLSDIVGRKKVFLTGAVFLTLATLLSPLSPTYEFFIFTRMWAGLGACGLLATAVSIISGIFEPHERGSALGVNTAFIYGGLSLGPVLGGILTGYLGWRSLFFGLVPILVVSTICFAKFMKHDIVSGKGEPMDVGGSVLYAVFVLLILLGLTRLPSHLGFLLIGVSLIPGFFFIRAERKKAYPVMDVNLFMENRVFRHSNFAAFFNYGATYATTFFLSLYLQSIGLISAQKAGLLLLIQPLFQTVLSPLAGKYSSKPYGRFMPAAGMTLIAVGFLGLTMLGASVNYFILLPLAALLGTGYALFSAPNTNMVMGSVSVNDQGKAGGILATMRQMGMVFSMAIAMSCITWFVGNADLVGPETASEFLGAMRTAFLICAALCLTGAYLSLSGTHFGKREKGTGE